MFPTSGALRSAKARPFEAAPARIPESDTDIAKRNLFGIVKPEYGYGDDEYEIFQEDLMDAQAQRNAKNFPIQGTSADILKRALAMLHEEIAGTNTRLVNIVHDEIIVECDANDADDISKILENAMRAAGEEFLSKVPVKVDVHVADEWTK